MYQVEEIIGRRVNTKTKRVEYKVKWSGYDVQESTWEPELHLDNVRKEILKFLKKQGLHQELEKQLIKKKPQLQQEVKKATKGHLNSDICQQKTQSDSKTASKSNFKPKTMMERPQKESEDVKQICSKYADSSSYRRDIPAGPSQAKGWSEIEPMESESHSVPNNDPVEVEAVWKCPTTNEFCYQIRVKGDSQLLSHIDAVETYSEQIIKYYESKMIQS